MLPNGNQEAGVPMRAGSKAGRQSDGEVLGPEIALLRAQLRAITSQRDDLERDVENLCMQVSCSACPLSRARDSWLKLSANAEQLQLFQLLGTQRQDPECGEGGGNHQDAGKPHYMQCRSDSLARSADQLPDAGVCRSAQQ